MTYPQIIEKYKKLTIEEKKIFLTLTLSDLIIRGRGTYTVGSLGVDDPLKLRYINELKHQVMNRLTDIIFKSDKWKDEEYFNIFSNYERIAGIKINFDSVLKLTKKATEIDSQTLDNLFGEIK